MPSIRGQTIDAAEAEITSQFASLFAGFAATANFDAVFTATNADELAQSLAAARLTAAGTPAVSLKIKIVCDWTGVSTLAAGAAANIIVLGFPGRIDGHLENAGGIYIVAAAGKSPGLGNQVNVLGVRGVHFDGIGFFRQRVGAERAETAYGAFIASNSTFPAKPIVLFSNCNFGARLLQANLPSTQWISGIGTIGLPDFVGIFSSRFSGHQSILKLAVRHCRIEGCDFQGNIQDAIDLFGHTFASGYHAFAWVTRCTFRNVADELAHRSEHMDAIQTGTSGDQHLGYRCLFTDLIIHNNHSHAGDPGLGGGTQGLYNDDHVTADNQFIMRRCIALVSAPHGFTFFSPRASKPSFVDQCTFMRCGRVPSRFAGDPNPPQDFGVGVTGTAPPAGPWLSVTRSFGMDLRKNTSDGSSVTLVTVDPRAAPSIPAEQRPETVFRGRDFSRGGAAANGIAGKFGYDLPQEQGAQAQFVADVWANFEPAGGFGGTGLPDPRSLNWTL